MSGEARCRAGIIERRIHQDDIDAVRGQTGRGKGAGLGCNVEHDDIGGNRIRGGVAARKTREVSVDLDQHELDSLDAFGDRKPGGADAGAQIDDAIA